ncbi:MAG: hypothetical protein ACYTAS_05230 [Planctomycetota bacterium]|jgi:hypothetical protein
MKGMTFVSPVRAVSLRAVCVIIFVMLGNAQGSPARKSGLAVEKTGTRLAYVTHNGKPLLAFGCHFEHMFFDDYDYKHWTQWAVRHGMNHCRTRLYHAYYRKYSPFLKTDDGRYDLTKWDQSFWQRFHEICSYLQSEGIIVHMLIFPQGTGGTWWQGDGYYLPENNVHPETAFIRPKKSTAGFWQSLSKGKHDLYEIQTAILWKLIDETADYDNIYYDICHEPFIRAMKPAAQQDLREFLSHTTKRFVEQYRELRPDRTPVLGLDTDFTPPGDTRDWIYGHDGFHIMIQGKNHDPFYITAPEAIELIKKFKKPFCPQESLDRPGIVHIPDVKHKNALTYFEPRARNHLRKYVWRWIMARSQLIDIYQKSLSKKVAERERYEPRGHNEFEKDALIIREFWDHLTDYPNLDFRGSVSRGPGEVQMVLSSANEAVVYLSSKPGVEGVRFGREDVHLKDLGLTDGQYDVEIWKPAAPGGIVKRATCRAVSGNVTLGYPAFVDDLAIHIYRRTE